MVICGVKLSHDGGIAVVDGQRLVFSVEVEKIGNGRRYSAIDDLETIPKILAAEGLSPSDVDQFVVDGWYTDDDAPQVDIGVGQAGRPLRVPVGPYNPDEARGGALRRYDFAGIAGGPFERGYVSYSHAS